MPTKNNTAPLEIYQLKVTLLGTMPPIWRRLLVPANVTLAQLHDVLQAAMGWQDCHMHEFSAGHRHFGRPNPEDRLMGMPPVENERTVRLSGVLGRVGAKALYTYDMGDSWEHGIVLEKRLPVDPGTAYPVCTGGERACPPEDCGGIGGFYDLLDALGDPPTSSMRNYRIGLVTITILTLSPSMRSIGCSRLAGGAGAKLGRRHGKQIRIFVRLPLSNRVFRAKSLSQQAPGGCHNQAK
jgi:hypothetical protein